jgi:hypothetical protein
MARSFERGHPVIWTRGPNWTNPDGSPIDPRRPCVRCGRPPTSDGHDACLAHLGWCPDITSACCGHGVKEGYVVRDGNRQPLEATP